MKKLIFRLPIYYLIIVVAMYFIQNLFIYHPEKSDPEQIDQMARSNGLRLWPDSVQKYRGFLSWGNTQKPRGTIVIFHGNAGNALDRTYYASALNRLDYRVVLAEYPGYGARPGKTNERQFTADALESIRLAEQQFGRPLLLLGESLGSGVVCAALAKIDIPIDGVALITPWDTLPDLAQALYRFIPARWMLKDRYDNIANLADFRNPVAIVMAGQDEIIPNRLTRRLYNALNQPKRLWTFPDAGHNNWPSGPHETWWGEMMNFLQSTKEIL